MTMPDGGAYAYVYDVENNLTSQTNPDNTQVQYVYYNANFVNYLNGRHRRERQSIFDLDKSL